MTSNVIYCAVVAFCEVVVTGLFGGVRAAIRNRTWLTHGTGRRQANAERNAVRIFEWDRVSREKCLVGS